MKAELHYCENIVLITIFTEPKAMPSSHKLDCIWGERKIEPEIQCVITLAIMLVKDDLISPSICIMLTSVLAQGGWEGRTYLKSRKGGRNVVQKGEG